MEREGPEHRRVAAALPPDLSGGSTPRASRAATDFSRVGQQRDSGSDLSALL